MTEKSEDRSNLHELARKAYIYGYPLVFGVDEAIRNAITERDAVNKWVHFDKLAKASDGFTSINNDTIYSVAVLDLSQGPMLLDLPKMDSPERFYSVLCIDPWCNNISYIGTRSVGNISSRTLYQWNECPMNNITHEIQSSTEVSPQIDHIIHCPSSFVVLILRLSCNDDNDVINIKKIQSNVNLHRLDKQYWSQNDSNNHIDHIFPPHITNIVDEPIAFWEKLRVYHKLYPPCDKLMPYVEQFKILGILHTDDDDSTSPYLSKNITSELYDSLVYGYNQGMMTIRNSAQTYQTNQTNNTHWCNLTHAFDYNISYFEYGTINDPKWVMPINNNNDIYQLTLTRSIASYSLLWGNHGYECYYVSTSIDNNNQQLYGGNNNIYILTLYPPPCDAFWSITMYDMVNFYLVDNSINRYSIGDRTKNLQYNNDGTLTIYISYDEPFIHDNNNKVSNELKIKSKANWLPCPNDYFRPILRIYLPHKEIYDGTYIIPSFVKVDHNIMQQCEMACGAIIMNDDNYHNKNNMINNNNNNMDNHNNNQLNIHKKKDKNNSSSTHCDIVEAIEEGKQRHQ